jgi:predicted MPP superfamily phosphohydrolase
MELIGVENYHKNPSKNYSDLSTATNNLNPNSFKILLSHNPLHWDYEVSSKTDIELTLSGHTHAGQMGVELFNKVISPVVVVYPKYNGIYRNEDQILYINRGIGYIGLPITFGLNPQISVIQLDKK